MFQSGSKDCVWALRRNEHHLEEGKEGKGEGGERGKEANKEEDKREGMKREKGD